MTHLVFDAGLTVKQLKKLLADWPEEDSTEEDAEVWVQTEEGLSSPVTSVWSLNEADILLSTID